MGRCYAWQVHAYRGTEVALHNGLRRADDGMVAKGTGGAGGDGVDDDRASEGVKANAVSFARDEDIRAMLHMLLVSRQRGCS